MKLAVLLLATPGLLAALAAAGSHGTCDGEHGMGILTIGTGQAGSPTLYLDDRYVLDNGERIYAESNGIAGLQRGGSSILIPADDETCWDDSANGPDALIY